MTTDTALLQQALDALEMAISYIRMDGVSTTKEDAVIEKVKARLAQPEQEPFAWENEDNAEGIKLCYRKFTDNAIPLYTHPQPARKPLSKSVIKRLWHQADKEPENFARAIEKVHGITE
jgi:hypothetical protein